MEWANGDGNTINNEQKKIYKPNNFKKYEIKALIM